MNNELLEWLVSHLSVKRTIMGDVIRVRLNETLNDENEEDEKIIKLLKEEGLYKGEECLL